MPARKRKREKRKKKKKEQEKNKRKRKRKKDIKRERGSQKGVLHAVLNLCVSHLIKELVNGDTSRLHQLL